MLGDNRTVAADRTSAGFWLESWRCSGVDGRSSPSTCGLFCHKSRMYLKNVASSSCYLFGLETGSCVVVRGWAETAWIDFTVA